MTAPRINWIEVENYRSIGAQVHVDFPDTAPLVILGENNAGKSNITRAIDILLGERWPTSRSMEEHDFHGRDSDGLGITVSAGVSGMQCAICRYPTISYLKWVYDPQNPKPNGDIARFDPYCERCRKTCYPSKELRSSIFAMRIDADRRLSYQLSYTNQYTLLSRLMHRFHERLLNDQSRKIRLEAIFQSLITEFGGVREFAQFRELLADTVNDLGQGMTYALDIDFSAYDPSNFFRSLRVHPQLANEVRSLDELGTGQEQILALAFAFAYARAFGHEEGLVLIIDEPETNLHPLAQQWLANRLSGMVAPGLQIVVTTHSPYFIDLSKPGSSCLVRKVEGATAVAQLDAEKLSAKLRTLGSDDKTTADSVGPFYAAAQTTETVAGMFARLCLLVEGKEEAFAMPHLLRLVDFEILKYGVACVSVEGLGNMAKWYRFYRAHDIPCYCIFDTDEGPGRDGQLNQHRDLLRALGVSVEAWDSGKDDRSAFDVASNFATQHPMFEPAMIGLFGERWSALTQEANSMVGGSKPLRARYAAERIRTVDLSESTKGSLRELANAIAALLPATEERSLKHENPHTEEPDCDLHDDDYEPDLETLEEIRLRNTMEGKPW